MSPRALPCFALLLALAAPRPAEAADVLFVSDFTGDLGIATALTAAGHTVEMVTNDYSGGSNARLRVSVDGYDAIFWSATGGVHNDIVVFANLIAYVEGGGRLFVTGFNAITTFPTDTQLIELLGGTGSRDAFTAPGPITVADNALNVGVTDIRGVTPSGSSNNDCLNGLGGDTVVVAGNGADMTCAQWSLRTLGGGLVAWVSAGSGSVWTASGGGGLGAYNAALLNFADSGESGEGDPGAPVIEFSVPLGLREGDPVDVSVTIEDLEGDTYSFSWDLDDDGTFGENADEFTYRVPEGTTDGPSGTRIGVEATDSGGRTSRLYKTLRVANVPPVVTSEAPTVASILVDLDYQIEIEDPAGDLDPPTFELAVGPPRMNVNDTGRVSWVPNESEITTGDELVRVEVKISDGDGGEVTHAWDMTVSPNRRPSSPVPSYPVEMVGIIDRTPRLAVQNGEDLDLDPLVYEFELDTVDSFDSEELRRSPPLDETPGFTAWQLEEPLRENQIYHWRVRADDGTTASPWRQAVFFVVRDPSLPPPDAGVVASDAGRGYDGALIPGLDAGTGGGSSGCAVRPGAPAPLPLLTLLGLALVLRRRR